MLLSAAAPGSPVAGWWGEYCLYAFIPANEDLAYMPGRLASYLDGGNCIWQPAWGIDGGFIAYTNSRDGRAQGYFHATAGPNFQVRVVGVTLNYDTEGGSGSGGQGTPALSLVGGRSLG